MPVRCTCEVERIQIRELPLVPIRRGESKVDQLALGNGGAVDEGVLSCVAFGCQFQGATVTQQLFHGGFDERRIPQQGFQLIRGLEQRQRTVGVWICSRICSKVRGVNALCTRVRSRV